jgi:energy-coupling factor transporter ATP-binding protein EcfA2
LIANRIVTILTGHFGSGKTELAINLALMERKKYEKVAINDLDIINPYFRSRDVAGLFRQKDIELLAPKEHLATSDLPIVSGEIYRVLHDHRYRVIIDAGGDKDGATALGQYYHEWKDLSPELLFVLNSNRPYVSTLDGALYTVAQIEKASRLKVTGIINNANIGIETTMEDIQNGYDLSCQVSDKLQIPLLFTSISTQLKMEAENFAENHKVMFIDRYMKLPWEGIGVE